MVTLTFTTVNPPATGWGAEGFPDESSISDTTKSVTCCCSPIATLVAGELSGPEKMNPDEASVTVLLQMPNDPAFAV